MMLSKNLICHFVFAMNLLVGSITFGQTYTAEFQSGTEVQEVNEVEGTFYEQSTDTMAVSGAIYVYNNDNVAATFTIAYQWDGEDPESVNIVAPAEGYNNYYLDTSEIVGGGSPPPSSRTLTVTVKVNGVNVMDPRVFTFNAPLPPGEF